MAPRRPIRFLGALSLVLVLGWPFNGALLARSLGPELIASEPELHADLLASAAPEKLDPQVGPAATIAPEVPPAALATAVPTARPVVAPVAEAPAATSSSPTWATSTTETDLWSDSTGGTLFNKVPAGAIFRVMDKQDERFRVFYQGDRANKRSPGEAWVDASYLAAAPWPGWVRLRRSASILSAPSREGSPLASLRPGAFVEVVEQSRGSWARVHYLGDGRGPAVEGWLEAEPTVPTSAPDVISSFALARDLLGARGPDNWLRVPYISQLDGTPYSDANCGPTAANMVLESFGFRVPQADLRREVLSLQPSEDCDDCGVYIQNLAEVIAARGLKIVRLRDEKRDDFHRWTLGEMRTELRAGRPVIAQVFYRGLPARASSPYWGDHFIVLTGTMGESFVFNDPIDSEGPGYSRFINARALELAMAESDYPYAAFSVGK